MKYRGISALAVVVGLVVSGCVTVPAVQSPLPAGKWSGLVEQSGPGSYRMSFDTQITLDGINGGTVSYASLGCGGRLEFVNMQKSAAIYREHIEYGRGCVDNGLLALEPAPGGHMIFSWQTPGIAALGRLAPAPR